MAVATAILVGVAVILLVGLPLHRKHVARLESERVGATISTRREVPGWISGWLPEDLESLIYDEWEVHFPLETTDSELVSFTGLTCVGVLRLGGTQVTDAGLSRLGSLRKLRALSLDGTRITDAGLSHLSGLSDLEKLSLYFVSVTDAGLDHFTTLTRLKTLYLYGTQVTDTGVAKLKKALPEAEIHTDWKIYE